MRIRARNITKRFHFSKIGFEDGRRADRSNVLWDALRAFASGGAGSGLGARGRVGSETARWLVEKMLDVPANLAKKPIGRIGVHGASLADLRVLPLLPPVVDGIQSSVGLHEVVLEDVPQVEIGFGARVPAGASLQGAVRVDANRPYELARAILNCRRIGDELQLAGQHTLRDLPVPRIDLDHRPHLSDEILGLDHLRGLHLLLQGDVSPQPHVNRLGILPLRVQPKKLDDVVPNLGVVLVSKDPLVHLLIEAREGELDDVGTVFVEELLDADFVQEGRVRRDVDRLDPGGAHRSHPTHELRAQQRLAEVWRELYLANSMPAQTLDDLLKNLVAHVLALVLLQELVGTEDAVGVADPRQGDTELMDVTEVEAVRDAIQDHACDWREERVLDLPTQSSNLEPYRFLRHNSPFVLGPPPP